SFISYSFKPQLRTVGPKYGKMLGAIKEALAGLDGNAAMAELNENEKLVLHTKAGDAELLREDLLIETTKAEGFEAQSWAGVTAVLDLALDEALIEEGFVREIVSKVQTMRKEAGFEVMDRITLYAAGNDRIEEILRRSGDMVMKDVLCDAIVTGETDGYTKNWNINGEKVTLGVKR
ncbi:MAG: isoleucine--tRNA ligase, partial [Lachnospiraceae bacterium]|nr:isoleucine--tRNA ligase [Lachnospiraceae bacterium]